MNGRIITGPDCIAEGAAALIRQDPRFGPAIARTGPLPLRLKPDGFTALLDAIVGQQISTSAAAAIWRRLENADLTDESQVRQASESQLQACGLSRPKVRYAKALATARINYPALRLLPNEQVIATLTAVPGIGPWTAEIYAMFSLGRADVFASGDLALQESARMLFQLENRPTASVLRAMAADWAPWRAVAARALWAYYRLEKKREGIR